MLSTNDITCRRRRTDPVLTHAAFRASWQAMRTSWRIFPSPTVGHRGFHWRPCINSSRAAVSDFSAQHTHLSTLVSCSRSKCGASMLRTRMQNSEGSLWSGNTPDAFPRDCARHPTIRAARKRSRASCSVHWIRLAFLFVNIPSEGGFPASTENIASMSEMNGVTGLPIKIY